MLTPDCPLLQELTVQEEHSVVNRPLAGDPTSMLNCSEDLALALGAVTLAV